MRVEAEKRRDPRMKFTENNKIKFLFKNIHINILKNFIKDEIISHKNNIPRIFLSFCCVLLGV
jgi:hypothetical protein